MHRIYVVGKNQSDLVTPDINILEHFIHANKTRNDIAFCNTPNEADIIVLFQEWSFKQRDYVQALLADPVFSGHSDKLYVVNYDSTVGEGFLPGCYVSLRVSSSYNQHRFRAAAYPKCYNHLLENPEPAAYNQPDFLYWFRGTLHSHPVRQHFFEQFKNSSHGLLIDATQEFHSHTKDQKKTYLTEMANSKFVLCPRGTSPNSYRLYEAMSIGRCPVIISDDWVETGGPEWANCSIRIAEKDINKIESILLDREQEAKILGHNARLEWLKHFGNIEKNQAYLNNIIELHCASPKTAFAVKRYTQHWKSRSFLKNNEWAFDQRLMRLFRRILRLA